jgi:hypothetical protein
MEVDFMSETTGKKIFISGSRSITELSDNVKKFIKKYVIDVGCDVLIGDCSGVDCEVQKFLRDNKYNKVTVYCSGNRLRHYYGEGIEGWTFVRLNLPEKGNADDVREYHATKDKIMTEKCDTALAIWDGKSRATGANIDRCLIKGKSTWVITTKWGITGDKYDDEEAYDEYVMWYDFKGYPAFVANLPLSKILDNNDEDVVKLKNEKRGYTRMIENIDMPVLKFDNGDKYEIHHDDKYGDYIIINNPYTTPSTMYNSYDDHTEPWGTGFSFRLRDAYDSVHEGYGDCITYEGNEYSDMPYISVLWFLDRNVGRRLRSRTLELWKDIEFGTCVLFNNYEPHLIKSENLIKIDEYMTSEIYMVGNAQGLMFKAGKYLSTPIMPLVFRSIPDAHDYIMSVIRIVKTVIKSVSDNTDKYKLYNSIHDKLDYNKPLFNDITHRYMFSGLMMGIYYHLSKNGDINGLLNDRFRFGQIIKVDSIEESIELHRRIHTQKDDIFFDFTW